jgi:hypothetical protein
MKRMARAALSLVEVPACGYGDRTMCLEERKPLAVADKLAIVKQTMREPSSPNRKQNLIGKVELIRNLKRENRQLKQLVANLTEDRAMLEAIVRKRGWGES